MALQKRFTVTTMIRVIGLGWLCFIQYVVHLLLPAPTSIILPFHCPFPTDDEMSVAVHRLEGLNQWD